VDAAKVLLVFPRKEVVDLRIGQSSPSDMCFARVCCRHSVLESILEVGPGLVRISTWPWLCRVQARKVKAKTHRRSNPT
jgi:hypothetical protein